MFLLGTKLHIASLNNIMQFKNKHFFIVTHESQQNRADCSITFEQKHNKKRKHKAFLNKNTIKKESTKPFFKVNFILYKLCLHFNQCFINQFPRSGHLIIKNFNKGKSHLNRCLSLQPGWGSLSCVLVLMLRFMNKLLFASITIRQALYFHRANF